MQIINGGGKLRRYLKIYRQMQSIFNYATLFSSPIKINYLTMPDQQTRSTFLGDNLILFRKFSSRLFKNFSDERCVE